MTVLAEFLVPPAAYPLGEKLGEYPGVKLEVERVVPTGGSVHYVWVSGEGRGSFVADLHRDPPAEKFDTVDELPDRTLLRFDWAGLESPLFRLAEGINATMDGMSGTHETLTVRVRFPDQEALAAFYEGCQEREIQVQLRQVYDPNSDPDDTGYGVTAKQAETLAMAFEAGYFDVPRRITLTELADETGVSEQAVSERLRRGLATLLRTTVFSDQPDKSTDRGATD